MQLLCIGEMIVLIMMTFYKPKSESNGNEEKKKKLIDCDNPKGNESGDDDHDTIYYRLRTKWNDMIKRNKNDKNENKKSNHYSILPDK